jgi:hypothetical protein
MHLERRLGSSKELQRIRKRVFVIEELLSTEEIYYHSLDIVVSVYPFS